MVTRTIIAIIMTTTIIEWRFFCYLCFVCAKWKQVLMKKIVAGWSFGFHALCFACLRKKSVKLYQRYFVCLFFKLYVLSPDRKHCRNRSEDVTSNTIFLSFLQVKNTWHQGFDRGHWWWLLTSGHAHCLGPEFIQRRKLCLLTKELPSELGF